MLFKYIILFLRFITTEIKIRRMGERKTKTVVMYDYGQAKSLKIYPKLTRQPLSGMALSNPSRVVRRALNAAEKEVRHLMTVANDRGKEINSINDHIDESINTAVADMRLSLNAVITESVKAGHHLVDEIFIPEYLGFVDLAPEKADEARVYAKDGCSMTRIDDRWLILNKDGDRFTVLLKNMYNAIIVLGSIGIDVSIEDYLDCKYTPGAKSLEESVMSAISSVSDQKKIG